MSEPETNSHVITLRHFWIIKTSLIIAIAVVFTAFGYHLGARRMEIAQQFGHDAAIAEYPAIVLMQSGQTFCQDRGNIYPAELVPTRRAMLPVFRTVRMK